MSWYTAGAQCLLCDRGGSKWIAAFPKAPLPPTSHSGFWPVFDQSMDVDLARASGVLSATTSPHVTTCVGEGLLLAPWLLNGRGCASPGAKTDLPWGLWASCCHLSIFWQVLYILVREHIHPRPTTLLPTVQQATDLRGHMTQLMPLHSSGLATAAPTSCFCISASSIHYHLAVSFCYVFLY